MGWSWQCYVSGVAGIDFSEMVGRLEGEAVGAFGALNVNLPPPKEAKFPVVTGCSEFEQGNGGVSSTRTCTSYPIAANR